MAEQIFDLDTTYQFYMSLLIKYLEKNKKYATAQLLHKAGFEIHTGYEYDNWNGGTYGHKVIILIAQETFISILDEKDSYTEEIKDGLNKVYNKENEYIAAIDIAASINNLNTIYDKISVYTQNKLPPFNDMDMNRIWGSNSNLKVFISHRDMDKKEASAIQDKLLKFNISSFVAHENIKATEEWIKEILRALQSMDILLVYMTDDFFNSKWTNQEIGFALGRNIPIIPFKNKINPDGFISILQAKNYNSADFISDFFNLLFESQSIHNDVRKTLTECLIVSFEKSQSWEESSLISKILDATNTISKEQAARLINAFNLNSNINECIYLSGYNTYGRKINDGVFCRQLKKWTEKEYEIKCSRGKVYIQEVSRVNDFPSFPSVSEVPF